MPTALITGANRGLGLATAEVMLKHGFDLILTARDLNSLKKSVKNSQILSKPPKKAKVIASYRLDVQKPLEAKSVAADLAKKGIKINALVNNAGMGGPTPVESEDLKLWETLVNINLTGSYTVIHYFLPLLPKGAAIINFSSVLGRFGVPGYSAYCASKHGVIGLTRALALELADKKIRVNAVCPGWADTRMAAEGVEGMAKGMNISVEDARKNAESGIPLGKFLAPEEVGELVAWLAGPHTRNMTGQAITLDGGQVMQ